MDILEALKQQKTPLLQERAMCNDGLLSISDAVFKVALYQAGYRDIDDAMDCIALENRNVFLRSINND
jgi:hypothetical protein